VGRKERQSGLAFAVCLQEDVTTQQIAGRADIGTGTLFLYAKSKGELLLLVQNAHYAEALERGRAAAETIPDELDAVMAILQPIVECNRVQVENGRTYLKEMVFGDSSEPRHREALHIVAQTEEAIAAVLARRGRLSAADAATMAHVVSAIMFLGMAGSPDPATGIEDIARDIRSQVRLLLPGDKESPEPVL
jgi:AcrR family transcriptional regulator